MCVRACMQECFVKEAEDTSFHLCCEATNKTDIFSAPPPPVPSQPPLFLFLTPSLTPSISLSIPLSLSLSFSRSLSLPSSPLLPPLFFSPPLSLSLSLSSSLFLSLSLSRFLFPC